MCVSSFVQSTKKELDGQTHITALLSEAAVAFVVFLVVVKKNFCLSVFNNPSLWPHTHKRERNEHLLCFSVQVLCPLEVMNSVTFLHLHFYEIFVGIPLNPALC